MVRGGKWEGRTGWGSHVQLWQVHVDEWQNQYHMQINYPPIKINKFILKIKNKKQRHYSGNKVCLVKAMDFPMVRYGLRVGL